MVSFFWATISIFSFLEMTIELLGEVCSLKSARISLCFLGIAVQNQSGIIFWGENHSIPTN